MIFISNEKHLPVYGVGPYLIGAMLIVSLVAITLSFNKIIPVYSYESLNWLLIILAVVLVIDGVFLWLAALRISKIDERIKNGQLVTDGVYALVRHPIYSAWLQISTALVLFSQNLILLVLPIIFWIFLTIAMIKTEEKWLLEKFGNDYVLYCQTTNRFIPFMKL
ncbi:MAG: isoprenylcysteine carboxylmethyltransferase family protein [Methanobrevibacter sp.]|uniref:methyltransferase family protein n=1 Tax=Methanobrevibacter sp. TaxID=66852 RepID=UPI00260088BF|nr:isoprenylcysteine carboxylmethyltransferase family protein [Methanobrevibacter sp.]MBR0272029.1 isoprenylcysteine carboxylmethyltransferase family protein [Methanobrevibacter sp.]